MKFRLAALTLLGTTMLLPSAVQAGGHTVDKFLQADTDNDEAVSKEEYMAKYTEKFTKLDSNGDEKVTPEEYEAYMEIKYEEYQKEKFDKMDTDGDGKVSFEEMNAHSKAWKHKH